VSGEIVNITTSAPTPVLITGVPTPYKGEIENITFTMPGTLTVEVGAARIYAEGQYLIASIRASVGGAPAGASVVVDLKVNGTSILNFTGSDHRLVIPAGAFTSGRGDISAVPLLKDGDYLTVDVNQVGTTTPGSDLIVNIRIARMV
jgi:hypothetical protein